MQSREEIGIPRRKLGYDKMELTHISLFAGIAGIDIAAEWAGFRTICFVENNEYCQKVLKKHWPNVPIIEDVKDVTKEKIMAYTEGWQNDRRERTGVVAESGTRESQHPTIDTSGETNRNTEGNGSNQVGEVQERPTTITGGICDDGCGITLISGGFPCQPHSVAGKREGSADERNLWPEFRRVIGEVKPRWVLAENVPGIFSSDAGRFFGTILADLAEMGYAAGWATYGAVDVGALHRRNRVFIVGYSKYAGWDATEVTRSIGKGSNNSQTGEKPARGEVGQGEQGGLCESAGASDVADTRSYSMALNRQSGQDKAECRDRTGIPPNDCGEFWAVEPDVGRVAHGISSRVDRLKCLGNAVVPQQIYPILKGIAEIEKKGFS